MPNDTYQGKLYQIYQLDMPGLVSQRHVVAISPKRAVEITISDDEELIGGAMLMVSNVTSSWMCHSPMASQSTWSLILEGLEGPVEYDAEVGWERVSTK